MMQLYGRSIPTENPALEIRRLYCAGMENFRILADNCGFYAKYWTYGSIPAVEKSAFQDLYQVFLKDAIQYILAEISRFGVYDYDAGRISKIYAKYAANYVVACKEVYAAYCEIQGDAQAAKHAREDAKNSRGKFVGGGFGVAGAAKGIAMAGAANLATGAIYSAGNMVGNALSQMGANSQSAELYQSPKTVKKLYDALKKDFLVGVDVLEEILVASQGSKMANPLNNQRLEKAKAIMKNIKGGIVPEAEQKKLLVNTMLNDAPYYDEIYFFAYETFGDDSGNLLEFAKLFGKDDLAERIKKKIEAKERDQAEEELEHRVFGENYETVHTQLKLDGKFGEFDDYYFHPVFGMYLDQDYSVILEKLIEDLREDGEMSENLLKDIVLFDSLPDKRKVIETYKELCDPLKLFQPEETAYCFIDLGITPGTQGMLITSKGLYFSPSCKNGYPFMDYDHIDAIVKSTLAGEIIFEHEETNIYLDKKWARLLAFTVLYFKYGDVKYTGKTPLHISPDTEQKLEATKQETRQKAAKVLEVSTGIGAVIGTIVGILFWVAVIVLIFRACKG